MVTCPEVCVEVVDLLLAMIEETPIETGMSFFLSFINFKNYL